MCNFQLHIGGYRLSQRIYYRCALLTIITFRHSDNGQSARTVSAALPPSS